jgi:hypothetical protein
MTGTGIGQDGEVPAHIDDSLQAPTGVSLVHEGGVQVQPVVAVAEPHRLIMSTAHTPRHSPHLLLICIQIAFKGRPGDIVAVAA